MSSHDPRGRLPPQLANKLLLKSPLTCPASSHYPCPASCPNRDHEGGRGAVIPGVPGQLQIVTYTGGRNRDGGTPAAGARISCMASGVPRKRRNAPAAALRFCRASSVTCQQASAGSPRSSTSDSSPRRSCWATRCSTAGATPAPSAAAACAAVWLGNTLILSSGIPSLSSSCPAAVPGSVPDGSISQRHWRGLPRRLECPAVTTTRR